MRRLKAKKRDGYFKAAEIDGLDPEPPNGSIVVLADRDGSFLEEKSAEAYMWTYIGAKEWYYFPRNETEDREPDGAQQWKSTVSSDLQGLGLFSDL